MTSTDNPAYPEPPQNQDKPIATLDPAECEEIGCHYEIEGVCSWCEARVCGSCFTERHEWIYHRWGWVADD